MQRRLEFPGALVVGLVAMLAGSAVFSMAIIASSLNPGTSENGFDLVIRWSSFNAAVSFAGSMLVAAALFGVAHRIAGWPRTLLLVGAWIQAAWTCWSLVRPYVFQLLSEAAEHEWFEGLAWRLMMMVLWCAIVVVTIAARAWWRPVTPWVTVAAVVLVVLEGVNWVPYVSSAIWEWGDAHPYAIRVFWPLRELASDGALVVVVYGIVRDAPPSLPEPSRAASWLHRAGAAILVRLITAIALGVLGLGLVKSPSALKLVFLLGPAIALLSSYGFGWSLLAVERAALPGMPKLRLILGALAAAVAASLQSTQLLAVYQRISDRGSPFRDVEVAQWTVIGPLIGIVGIAFACSAIASWALTIGNERLRELAIARAAIYGVLNVVVMAVPFLLENARSESSLLLFGLIAAVGAIVSLALVAGVFHRAAEAIAPGPSLPEARLR